MIFILKLNDPTIAKAAAIVEKHFDDRDFLKLLALIKHFNFTEDDGSKVADKIGETTVILTVEGYRTKWPWSKAIAREEEGKVLFNTRKMTLDLSDRVETLMHEGLHAIGYAHSGNTADNFNLGAVPYAVSKLFVEYLKSIKVL